MAAKASPKVRVLLVDDLPDIRLVMRLLLEADGRVEVVGEAAEGSEGVRLAGEVNLPARTIILCGRTADMAEAFGVSFKLYVTPQNQRYRGRKGGVQIPAQLENVIKAVVGCSESW